RLLCPPGPRPEPRVRKRTRTARRTAWRRRERPPAQRDRERYARNRNIADLPASIRRALPTESETPRPYPRLRPTTLLCPSRSASIVRRVWPLWRKAQTATARVPARRARR